ncbi:MAG: hypothetical protein Q7S45_04750 [Candidatus Curtissbacteria bacterium]|nr:hypothetical protein [Candidatus Curtissbacteria bacterium]
MLSQVDFRVKQEYYKPVFTISGAASQRSRLFDWGSIGKIKLRVLITFSILLTCLFLTQLVFAANLSTDGQKLAIAQEAIAKYESENADIRAQIARQSSLTNLSQKAEALGFSANPKIINP